MKTKIPFFRRFVIQNFPFIESDFDALTDYQLLSKVVEYLNKVIKETNQTSEQMQVLQDYVEHYFDNLDVQEEINNKLDAMAEAGTLEEIIGQYIHSSALLGFDTVSAMKQATNLINGSFAQTYGYNVKNDGGACKYKIRTITNEDVVDEMKIIELADSTLVAEMVETTFVTPEMAGCVGNGTTDDTTNFQKLLAAFNNIHLTDDKTYLISDTIIVSNYTKLIGNGYKTKIKSSINNGDPIFENNDNVMHFDIENFYIDADNKNSIGFDFYNPYDSCVFRDIYFDNFVNSCLKMGDSTLQRISQSLVVDNCMCYMSNTATVDNPIMQFDMVYEMNFTNNKLLYRVDNIGSAPCLKLNTVIDLTATGNSFADTSDCGIEMNGGCRYNRIISNTYENITGTYSIKLLGTNADDIQYTYIAEAGTYYNAPNKVYCQNEVGGTIIGLVSEGGRKNINILPVTPKANDPTGNVVVGGQGNNLFTNGIYLQNYDGSPKWRMFQNSSAQTDLGLTFGDGEGHTFRMFSKSFINNQNGGKIMLKSPDGTKIKYLGINNNGEFYLANFEYE